MSEADNFVKARRAVIIARPKIELNVPERDNRCLFRVSKDGNMEYHYTSEFSVFGEHQGETMAQYTLTPEEALKLANWIQQTFK